MQLEVTNSLFSPTVNLPSQQHSVVTYKVEKVGIILRIKESVNISSDRGNQILMHWVGYQVTQTYKAMSWLINRQEVANEMVGLTSKTFL